MACMRHDVWCGVRKHIILFIVTVTTLCIIISSSLFASMLAFEPFRLGLWLFAHSSKMCRKSNCWFEFSNALGMWVCVCVCPVFVRRNRLVCLGKSVKISGLDQFRNSLPDFGLDGFAKPRVLRHVCLPLRFHFTHCLQRGGFVCLHLC